MGREDFTDAVMAESARRMYKECSVVMQEMLDHGPEDFLARMLIAVINYTNVRDVACCLELLKQKQFEKASAVLPEGSVSYDAAAMEYLLSKAFRELVEANSKTGRFSDEETVQIMKEMQEARMTL
jgi:hypothetical protein